MQAHLGRASAEQWLRTRGNRRRDARSAIAARLFSGLLLVASLALVAAIAFPGPWSSSLRTKGAGERDVSAASRTNPPRRPLRRQQAAQRQALPHQTPAALAPAALAPAALAPAGLTPADWTPSVPSSAVPTTGAMTPRPAADIEPVSLQPPVR